MNNDSKDYVSPMRWVGGRLSLLDQLRLPEDEFWVTYDDPFEIAEAIRGMVVRGAPAIGITAAYALAQYALQNREKNKQDFRDGFYRLRATLAATRPTAVNLFWALDKMGGVFDDSVDRLSVSQLAVELDNEAQAIEADDLARCQSIGRNGAALLSERKNILTVCNAGALATAGWGTALGVIRSAHYDRGDVKVLACETRPYLQGARLTAWELQRESIPVALITDGMAGFFMQRGEVDAVIVGADRVAENGDAANKIGTYSLAVLAKHHGIPFYVAAPLSTFDRDCASGKDIPIEFRSSVEVTHLNGVSIAPEGVEAKHPAFDVTPASLITAVITDRGVAAPVNLETVSSLFG